MAIRSPFTGLLVVIAVAAMTACTRTDAPEPIDQNAVVAVDDERLATYVQARYQADSSIRANDISVTATNGVVVLRGIVPDESVREQAVSIAREVEGVRTVESELQVRTGGGAESATTSKPAESTTPRASMDPITPGWITTKIQAQYFVNPEIKPWNIDVTTNSEGAVTLRGEVDEAADREEAERIARATEGVVRVDNHLRTRGEATARADQPAAGDRPMTGSDSPDGWVTAKVQAKYFMDSDVKGRNINVDTKDGVVTLRGEVESESERRQAVAIARNTDGVQSVTDQLRVTTDTSTVAADEPDTRLEADLGIDDVWIATKIQSKFFLDDDIKGRDVNVDVRDGVVYLKGTVESETERMEAASIARETEGVSRVENLLTVDVSARRQ